MDSSSYLGRQFEQFTCPSDLTLVFPLGVFLFVSMLRLWQVIIAFQPVSYLISASLGASRGSAIGHCDQLVLPLQLNGLGFGGDAWIFRPVGISQ